MNEEERDRNILEMAKGNHIWLNALSCVNPTQEFLADIGRQVLQMLGDRENLLPLCDGRLGELTPVLYLNINKS